ncbi:pre-rRNA-processing protein TSR1 homolog [Zingiber officinale]|uniref:pre-rRNA-processing protein TSR1 homolog n=1 Tax=Zingiber officinale TaxID=94328 RepID=UPI001C4CA585|nr:pre-rRNA-processing protein TSR1 homolog [Zingiber officinale]
MGGSRTQANKAHKSRFASKSSRQLHRTSGTDGKRIGKPDSHRAAVKGARAARIQRSKMIRDQKRAALLKEKRSSTGSSSPPRVIVLFDLSSSTNLGKVARDLLMLSSGEDTSPLSNTVASSIYKFRLTVLEAPHGDLLSCVEMAKIADLIAFVVSANSLVDEYETSNPVDAFGQQCLSVFRAIGLPSTAVLIRDLPSDIKRKQDFKKLCISHLSSELPEDCKFYLADTRDDLHKFMWLFKEQSLSCPHWRNQRPYLMSQETLLEPDHDNPGMCSLLLSGYVRAHSLSANQLVHVSGTGDFPIAKIDILKDRFPINERKSSNSMDADDMNSSQVIQTLLPDPLKQEPLVIENVADPLAGEQTWPTEAEMAEAEANNKERKLVRKRLPRGTSDYQAAWIVEDTDDDSNLSEEDDDGMIIAEHGDQAAQENSDHSDIDDHFVSENFDDKTIGDTEMADDENMTKEQIEAEVKKIKEAYADDQEFPDEVETPIDVLAKKRFAKYRGLKSFRTSSWDPKESLPPEYSRIFAFDNFAKTQKNVLAKMLEVDEGNVNECAPVGSYVRIYLKSVPLEVSARLCLPLRKAPVLVCGLLQHESKMSVQHFSIKKHDSYDAPIRSKEMLSFHVGFRQFNARPLFSSDNLNSDKHKMERFLHPGRYSMASVYAPINFPPLPLVILKTQDGEAPAVAALGSLKSVDPDRIILKKIILTGYPQRVSKSKSIVRYMFHNPEDVRWFKPLEVWTKGGRRGRIMETVGTHGAMKCIFNGVIQQNDTVCISLYKRVYPKWPEQCYAS